MLRATLEKIRTAYLSHFLDVVLEIKSAGHKPILEAAYRDQNGAIVREGELALGLRGDVFFVEDSKMQSKLIELTNAVPLAPFAFVWDGTLDVTLGPFCWEECRFRISDFSTAEWGTLVRWFDTWFDAEDAKVPDDSGLSGVVHFLSDPKEFEGGFEFIVDFGSAGIEAFEQLLDSLKELGAKRIEIGELG